jgi:NhaA family Na+:H+ antiporter
LGIFGAVYGLYRLGLVSLPPKARLMHFFGAAILGGIGFTMSLFIASLAFDDAASLMTAKMSIVCASLLSGIAGTLLFILTRRKKA